MSKPVSSMTGYARVAGSVTGHLNFTLTLKSVNHRYLDLQFRLPSGTDALEMQMRRILKERLVRGHVDVTLTLERGEPQPASYNSAMIASYVEAFREAAAEHGLNAEPDLNSIFRLPGVFAAETRSREEDVAALAPTVLAQLDQAVAALNTMRAQEGAALAAELEAALTRLAALSAEAERLRSGLQQVFFERTSQRLAAMLDGAFDRERLVQEAAMLAERSDVEEELVRMRTHITHFRELLAHGGEAGKKLDFLLQEMNREANTLLSKTSGLAGEGPKVTALGLQMKSEIEKAREQVQNLE